MRASLTRSTLPLNSKPKAPAPNYFNCSGPEGSNSIAMQESQPARKHRLNLHIASQEKKWWSAAIRQDLQSYFLSIAMTIAYNRLQTPQDPKALSLLLQARRRRDPSREKGAALLDTMAWLCEQERSSGQTSLSSKSTASNHARTLMEIIAIKATPQSFLNYQFASVSCL